MALLIDGLLGLGHLRGTLLGRGAIPAPPGIAGPAGRVSALMLALSHRRWTVAVDAYVDGELTCRDRREVAAHMTDCWACSREVEILRLMKHCLCAQRRRAADGGWE
ncbi:MAG: zf-HC2 domain-containing protein [Actinobacteria bacterium]|nr:zf-HC2 domain-containing protein [Actinomycetota bacterium]